MTSPTLSAVFASLLVFLTSPANGAVVSNTITLSAQVETGVKLNWEWFPSPQEMGGLSTNDYATNVWFQLWTTTNVTLPLTNWTMIADNIPAYPYSTQYTASASIDAAPHFYVAYTVTARDRSPPSNVLPYLHSGGQLLLSIGK